MKIKMRSWRDANRLLVNHAMSDDWFNETGRFDIVKAQTGVFCSNAMNKDMQAPYKRPVGMVL